MKKLMLLIIWLDIGVLAMAQTTITGYEYWLNDNYAGRTTVNVTPTPVYELQADISPSPTGLPPALHRINIRFIDSDGRYSGLYTQYFMTYREGTELTWLHYWFDDPTQPPSNIQLTGNVVHLIQDLSAVNLSNGMHTLYLQVLDNGLYKSPLTMYQFFKHTDGSVSTINSVVGYEYWADGGTPVYQPLLNPGQWVFVQDDLAFSGLSFGEHALYVRFKDEKGLWSGVLPDTFSHLPTINPSFDADNTMPCTDEQVQFTNYTTQADTFHWDFGDGNTSTDRDPVHVYSQAGTYSVTLWAGHTSTDVDSSITRSGYIQVQPIPVADFAYSISGATVTFSNTSSDATDFYWDFGDGLTSNAEDPVHSYTVNDTYAVRLIAEGDCGADTLTQSVAVTTVGISGPSPTTISLFPNPARQQVTLFIEGLQEVRILVSDLAGRVVDNRILYGSMAITHTWDVSNWSSGIYVVQVSTSGMSKQIQLAINH